MEIFSKRLSDIIEADLKNLENNPKNFESFQIEYKADYDNDADELRRDILQFANGFEIGYIFYGYLNNPIRIIGIERNRVDVIKNILNNIFPTKIDPTLSPFPKYAPVPLSNGKYVFIIEVFPKDKGIYGIRQSENMSNINYKVYEFFRRMDGSKHQMNTEEIVDLIENKGKIANLPDISITPNPNDVRINILITILKNLTIRYFKEREINNKHDPNFNRNFIQLLNIINDFRPSYLERFSRNLRRAEPLAFTSFYFHTSNLNDFLAEVVNNHIVPEKITRPIRVLTGDLAFVINELYNEIPHTKENYLDRARQYFQYIIQNNDFLQEDYKHDSFNETINILNNEGIIRSKNYQGSDSKEKYVIINTDRLQKFVTAFSLQALLKRII